MSPSRIELPTLDEIESDLKKKASADDKNGFLSVVRRIYRQCDAAISDALDWNQPLVRNGEPIKHPNNYALFASDLGSRDALRQIHFRLTTYLEGLDQGRPNVEGIETLAERIEAEPEKEFRAFAVSATRRFSARAIIASRWSYGIAFMMAIKAECSWPSRNMADIAHELVATLVGKIQKGSIWYDPVREQHPGAWLTTWFYRLAKFRNSQDAFDYVSLDEQLDSCVVSVTTTPIHSGRLAAVAKAASLVDRLPPDERFVIRQRYWENMSLREIAELMDVTMYRVRQLYKSAISRLIEMIR